jgi:predicted glutamine amidotransferase
MCELLTILANREVSASLSWAGLQMGASNNPHGWGVTWLKDEEFRLKKDPTTLPTGRRGRDLIHGIRSKLFLAHTRYRVQGRQTAENTQPFLSTDGRYAFAGTMHRCLGRRALRKRVQDRLQGETGPEVLFQLMLSASQGHGVSGMRRVVKEFFALDQLPEGARASFVFCTPTQIFVFRHRKLLHHLQRAGPHDGSPIYLRGSRHHRYELTLKEEKEVTDRAAIIATEKLTNENWRLIPDRTLMLMTLNGLLPA